MSSSERAHRDVDVLALAQRQAGLVVEAHQAQDRAVGEAEVGQAVEGDARQAEHRVAGVDRLRDAVDRPQRRAVAALDVAVLDVVVDEREVVAELDRGGARQRALVVAGDAGVGEQAEQRSHPLAARRPRPVECEVVADHLVQPVGRRIAVLHEADDLALGVGDQGGEVDVRGRGRHPAAECTRNVYRTGSLIARSGPATPGGSAPPRQLDAGAGDATAPASIDLYVSRIATRIAVRIVPSPPTTLARSRDTVAQMPIPRRYTTDAIVLSRFDLGEADRVLTLITPGIGKLKAIAKGVRRPTSRLGGSLEPFAELTVALARGRTFDVVTQVSVGHAWLNLRDSLESAATAWYLAELADRSLEERHAAEPLYALLRRAYELLDAGMAPGRVARWYEMHLLDELGQRPEVDRCVECDRVLEAEERFRWVPPLGGILCERCPGPGPRPDGHLARGAQAAQGLPAPRHRGDLRAAPGARRRARDRGRPARVRADRARARRTLAGLPRRGPDAALTADDRAP